MSRPRWGRWAIVTGASSGIGEAFAQELAREKHDLVLVARRLDRLERLATSLAANHGVEVRAVELDLSHPERLSSLFEVTSSLDVGLVVSNAGGGQMGHLLSSDIEDQLATVRLNIDAHLRLVHHYGRRLVARGRGGLLLISSTSALQGVPYLASYSAAKAFTVNLAEALRFELAGTGVQLTTLLPGPTATPMLTDNLDAAKMPMRPMSPAAVAREGLQALAQNRATHIAGASNRMMAKLPRALAVQLWASLMRRLAPPARLLPQSTR